VLYVRLPGSWFTWFIISILIVLIAPHATPTIGIARLAILLYLTLLLISALSLLSTVYKITKDPLFIYASDIVILIYGVFLGLSTGLMVLVSPVGVDFKVPILILTAVIETCIIIPIAANIIRRIIGYGLRKILSIAYPTLIAIIVVIVAVILVKLWGANYNIAVTILLAIPVIITTVSGLKGK